MFSYSALFLARQWILVRQFPETIGNHNFHDHESCEFEISFARVSRDLFQPSRPDTMSLNVGITSVKKQ